jgi:hypothetical protein
LKWRNLYGTSAGITFDWETRRPGISVVSKIYVGCVFV